MSESHIHVRRDTLRLVQESRERAAGHPDHAERAQLVSDVEWEAHLRGLSSPQLHEACGLDDGALRAARLPTAVLHAALERIRGIPR